MIVSGSLDNAIKVWDAGADWLPPWISSAADSLCLPQPLLSSRVRSRAPTPTTSDLCPSLPMAEASSQALMTKQFECGMQVRAARHICSPSPSLALLTLCWLPQPPLSSGVRSRLHIPTTSPLWPSLRMAVASSQALVTIRSKCGMQALACPASACLLC